jgi:hypothetical protein
MLSAQLWERSKLKRDRPKDKPVTPGTSMEVPAAAMPCSEQLPVRGGAMVNTIFSL